MSEKRIKEARKYKLNEAAMAQVKAMLAQRQQVEATIQTYVRGLMDAQGIDSAHYSLNIDNGYFEEKPNDSTQ